MTGDTATRLALGAAVVLGVALAAAIALTGGRETPTAVPQGSGGSAISAQDARALSRTRPWIRDWNVASNAWVRALTAGRERFLPRYEAYTRRMDVNSLRIRLSASRIENPRLRVLLRRLGDVYRQQFRAVQDVNLAVLAGDRQAARAAVARLESADDEKIRAATALVDAFPEVGGDLNHLK